MSPVKILIPESRIQMFRINFGTLDNGSPKTLIQKKLNKDGKDRR
jgi:hypothetical protein